MASISISASAVATAFEQIKQGAIGKVTIPTCTNLNSGPISPLSPTAAVFTPSTKSTSVTTADAGKAQGNSDTNQKGTRSYTTHSRATSTSSISSTPVTWADEKKLEELVGRNTTNELLTNFDPSCELHVSPHVTTYPLLSAGARFEMHKLVERIWGDRLYHETDSKTSRMYIWVPGSRVPKWLEQLHKKRSARSKPASASPTTQKQGTRTPLAAPRQVDPAWAAFATDENARYQAISAMTAADYIAHRKKEESDCASGTYKTPSPEPEFNITETFKQTSRSTANGKLGGPRKTCGIETTRHTNSGSTIVSAENTNPLPQASVTAVDVNKPQVIAPHLRLCALPPHLRAKAAAAESITTAEECKVWVAAKLPTPFN